MGQRIYVKNKDCAIVIEEDYNFRLLVPKTEIVGSNTKLLVTLAILLKKEDDEFFEFMQRKWSEIDNEYEESQKKEG